MESKVRRLSIPKFVLGSIFSCAWACACFAQPKKVVKSESELPRFTYESYGERRGFAESGFGGIQRFLRPGESGSRIDSQELPG